MPKGEKRREPELRPPVCTPGILVKGPEGFIVENKEGAEEKALYEGYEILGVLGVDVDKNGRRLRKAVEVKKPRLKSEIEAEAKAKAEAEAKAKEEAEAQAVAAKNKK